MTGAVVSGGEPSIAVPSEPVQPIRPLPSPASEASILQLADEAKLEPLRTERIICDDVPGEILPPVKVASLGLTEPLQLAAL
jgi:hypothetical protein